jgi:molybdate transport system ATP-binding protein
VTGVQTCALPISKLLILDDPFCGLDTAAREVLKNALEEVLAVGTPQIVLVTPRVEEIPQGITHLLCVADNRVVDQGPKTHILQTDFARQIFTPQRDPLPLQIPVIAKREFPSPTLIEMKNTSVSYGGVEVLRDITWTMKPGEHWAILGPNGAGKTTLLSLILADNPQAYANDLTLFGIRRGSGESIWDIKQHIGWVSPELQIYYHSKISCHQVACSGFFDSVGLYQACSSDQEQIVTQWMCVLGIEALADHPFSTASVGEQRLVLLARALVKKPLLLVLDEPCQGLDGNHRLHILALLDQLCLQAPVSLLYVTHHVDEMPAAITHVLRLEHGRIRDIGTRQRVLG